MRFWTLLMFWLMPDSESAAAVARELMPLMDTEELHATALFYRREYQSRLNKEAEALQ